MQHIRAICSYQGLWHIPYAYQPDMYSVQATPPEPPSLPPTPPTPPTPPPCVDDNAAAHEVYMSSPHIELGQESDTSSEHGCAELLASGPADVCEPSGYFSTCCKTCTDLAEFQANLPCPTGPADVGEMLFSSKAWSSGRSGYDRWQRPPPVFHTPFLTMAPTAPYQSWGWPSTKVETLIMPIRMGTVDQQKQEITADYDMCAAPPRRNAPLLETRAPHLIPFIRTFWQQLRMARQPSRLQLLVSERQAGPDDQQRWHDDGLPPSHL